MPCTVNGAELEIDDQGGLVEADFSNEVVAGLPQPLGKGGY